MTGATPAGERVHDLLRRSALLRWADRTLAARQPCWVAGGFVRDLLLGRPSRDLDLTIATDHRGAAEPAHRLAAALGVRPHLLGSPPLAVWRVESPALKVELWPLASLTLEQDLVRRDFTVNAMAWRLPAGPFADLCGGLDDLRRRRLRAVSAANLADDPVRMVRAARFLAELPDFELDADSAGAIRDTASAVAAAPRERLGHELLRLLRAPSAGRGVVALTELGLLAAVSPDAARVDRTWTSAHGAAATALSRPARHPLRGALRDAGDGARLALLARAWRAGDHRTLAPYAWPRDDRRVAVAAADALDRVRARLDAPAAERRELLWRLGDAAPALLAFGSAVALAAGDDLAPWRRLWRLWRRRRRELLHPDPLLGSAEALALLGPGTAGPELGAAIRRLERARARGELRTREQARRLVRGMREGRGV